MQHVACVLEPVDHVRVVGGAVQHGADSFKLMRYHHVTDDLVGLPETQVASAPVSLERQAAAQAVGIRLI